MNFNSEELILIYLKRLQTNVIDYLHLQKLNLVEGVIPNQPITIKR